jgi:mRNA-degrading endonuclease toxin of MazEF toxin-antitoxin module
MRREQIQKARPALVISDMTIDRRYRDLVVAAITSKVPDDPKEIEAIIERTPHNGLAKRSCIRLDHIFTLPQELVSRKVGKCTPEEMKGLDAKLAKSLGLSLAS